MARVRTLAITYEYTAGAVSGPGHEGEGCVRSDYANEEEDKGFDELTDETMSGHVLIEGAPYLEFSGTRRD